MGHVQYYLQYKDQPFVYREGANPGTPYYFLFLPILPPYFSVYKVVTIVENYTEN